MLAYNVPELAGKELVLSFDTIAQIYLGNITFWNDSRIKEINSIDVADALPPEPIRVIVVNISNAYTQLFTELLSETVPEFAAQVGTAVVFYFAPPRDWNVHQFSLLPLTHSTQLDRFGSVRHIPSIGWAQYNREERQSCTGYRDLGQSLFFFILAQL